MYVQVRTVDGKTNITITVSKLTSVEEFRGLVENNLGIKREKQRFFYRGKQLEDGYKIFDYDVRLNDVIQLMVKPDVEVCSSSEDTDAVATSSVVNGNPNINQEPEINENICSSKYYKVGDLVDVRNVSYGAWFEGKIVGILKRDRKIAGVLDKGGEKLEATKRDNEIDTGTELKVLSNPVHNEDCKELDGVKHDIGRELKEVAEYLSSGTGSCRPNTKHESAGKEANKLYAGEKIINQVEDDMDGKCYDCDDEFKETGDSQSSNGFKGFKETEHLQALDGVENVKEAELEPSNGFKGFEIENMSVKQRNTSLISIDKNNVFEKLEDDGLIYKVILEEYKEDPPFEVNLQDLRPRARHKFNFDDLNVNDIVLANYNIEDPKSRGYWYDVYVTAIRKTRTTKEIIGSVCTDDGSVLLENCKIIFCEDILKIEKPKLISSRSIEDDELMQTETSVSRQNGPNCSRCRDNPRVKCKECSCYICGGKDDPGTQILCDECNMAYHIRCLDPPLESVPDSDEWYCPECKNDENEIVKAGEKLKDSKKKAKLPSKNTSSTRDWGKGMACVGRTKECTLVPSNHYGPIPGIEVGTTWLYRVQVSESGVHRPPVGGIHGRESDGAYSIVLSGGYEDDVDNGDEFYYTGSGGRDLSGNKRTADQSCDQTLTRLNKALALNCNAQLSVKGAEAKNWKGGKAVRVVRNYKLSKHSKYAPEVGNRYDGIYKVVKYYPEKGKSGFVVWRYLLHRDDESPAPWTPEGKKFMKLHGLDKPLVPEGYLEANEEKLKLGIQNCSEEDSKKRKSDSKKRSLDVLKDSNGPNKKKLKTMEYKLDKSVKELIDQDINKKLWDSCSEYLKDGKQKFIEKVAEVFMCICCQELVYKPVTTECKHNLCKRCLLRSFAAEVYSCPYCRQELGEKYKWNVNETLAAVLCKLFPGYDHGR